MKNVDYIIVGDGYAALFFAHQLIKNNKNFVLFSAGKKSASHISAGIINPVVLKKFTTFWLAKEQIDFLNKTLLEIEKYTGKNYLISEPIHRVFHDENEKNIWLKKSAREELKPFLHQDFSKLNSINNPYGTGVVNFSSRLEVDHFFVDYCKYLIIKDYLIQEKFQYELLDSEKSIYKNICFKNIVFCEGTEVSSNPYFKSLPIQPNKGHHLVVKLSQPIPHDVIIKKKHFLFPLNDGNYYYGGTYDRLNTRFEIDEHAVEQLKNSLKEIYPYDFEVIEINYGFRPTVKDRRPILGSHNKQKNYYVFNGLGARGILNGCYFSKTLFDFIEFHKPLRSEIDLKRFEQ